MSKSFKQVSTGLTLVCEREDVIEQYEKYPDQYIPLGDAHGKKSIRPTRPAQKAQATQKTDSDNTEQAPDKSEKQEKK